MATTLQSQLVHNHFKPENSHISEKKKAISVWTQCSALQHANKFHTAQ